MIERLGQAGVAVLAAALLALPFGTALWGDAPMAIYNALAADTYYYAAMARNFTLHGFFGVDGETISSGYMPLWQITVALLDGAFAGPGTAPEVLLTWIFRASVLFAALGVAGLGVFVARRYGTRYAVLALPLICPGATLFLVEHSYRTSPTIGLHSSTGMWSFANGMESGIGLFLFAVFVFLAARSLDTETTGRRVVFWTGTIAFLIFMARLDDVFVGLAFGLCLLPVAWKRDDSRLVIAAALVPLIGTAAYLGINTAMTGGALPSSGMLKTNLFGFPSGWDEFASIGQANRIDTRMFPLVAAFGAGVLGLLSQVKKTARSEDTPIIMMLSLYLILKTGFLLSSVPVYEQGYWYYTNLLASVNLLVVMGLARIIRVSRHSLFVAAPAAFALTIVAAINAEAKLNHFPADSYTTVARDLCTDPEPVRAMLPPDARIIDTGDGVYAFCTGRPAVTLTGLSDSRVFNNQRNEMGFFPAALAEGHTYLLASPVDLASYDWRGQLGTDHVATPLGRHGLVRVWQIEASE